MSILNRIYFNSNTKIKAPASPAKGRRSNESPRQIVTPVPCPAGHTSDAIPTEASAQGLPAHRRGIAWSGTNLWPRLMPGTR